MRALVVLLVSAVATSLTACSEPSAPDTDAAPVHVHTDDHEHGGHEAGHQGHDEMLGALLVEAGDLPAGYVEGMAHHASTSAPARIRSGCAPLADVIGEPASRSTRHPQAHAMFSKSHFGPQLTETVIELGSPEAAQAAAGSFAQSPRRCRVYRQAAHGPGAFRYDVREHVAPAGAPAGHVVRLVARGADFEGIHWDVWVTARGSRLVAVALRSARGGSSVDLLPAVDAALARLT